LWPELAHDGQEIALLGKHSRLVLRVENQDLPDTNDHTPGSASAVPIVPVAIR